MDDRRKCQTYAASPAEPGGLPVMLDPLPAICLAIAAEQAQRLLRWPLEMRPVMNGNIFNSKGIHVGTVTGAAIFDLKGENSTI
jgi:hypothetical protein